MKEKSLLLYQLGDIARKSKRQIAAQFNRGVSAKQLAAQYQVSTPYIYKLLSGKIKKRPKSKPNLRLNQFTRTNRLRSQWSQLADLYKKGDSVNSIAHRFKVCCHTITKILKEHDIYHPKYKKRDELTDKEIAARINLCRRPDLILWRCDHCYETYDGAVMPFSCKCCGNKAFTRTAFPMPLDVSRLDTIDGTDPIQLSRTERKRSFITSRRKINYRLKPKTFAVEAI